FARGADPISAGSCAPVGAPSSAHILVGEPVSTSPGYAQGEKRNMAASKDVRRVVTTVDGNGKAVVLLDGANPHTKARAHGTVSHLLWVADETPTDMRGPKDRAAREIGIAPPAGGSVFRIVDFPPTAQEVDA